MLICMKMNKMNQDITSNKIGERIKLIIKLN